MTSVQQTLERPNNLERLCDDVSWFACATELRVHLVVAPAELYPSVLRLIMRGSRVSERPTPYLLFVEPFEGKPASWKAQIATLDTAREALAEELKARGTSLAQTSLAQPAATSRGQSDDIGAFALRLIDFVKATREVCAAPVVVLAPSALGAEAQWQQELAALLVAKAELAAIRWVLVVREERQVAMLLKPGGPSLLVSDCRAGDGVGDAAGGAAWLATMVANAEAASEDAAPQARLGMAWPQVAPPARRDAVGSLQTVAAMSEAQRGQLAARHAVLHAVVDLQAQKGPEAIQHFRAAEASLRASGMPHEALHVRLLMLCSAATLGEAPLACEQLGLLAKEAAQLQASDICAQALSAQAGLLLSLRKAREALASYEAAIQAAREAGQALRPLLVELLRTAGQLCLEHKQEAKAVACFKEALAEAGAEPLQAGASGIEAAKVLANVCRARGLPTQAAFLEAQAEALHVQIEEAAAQLLAKSPVPQEVFRPERG